MLKTCLMEQSRIWGGISCFRLPIRSFLFLRLTSHYLLLNLLKSYLNRLEDVTAFPALAARSNKCARNRKFRAKVCDTPLKINTAKIPFQTIENYSIKIFIFLHLLIPGVR